MPGDLICPPVIIYCAKNDTADSMQEDPAHTHQTGFQGCVESHLSGIVPQLLRNAAQRLDFGVAVGVVIWVPNGVLAFSDYFTIEGDDSAYGQIAFAFGVEGEFYGSIKECDVGFSDIHGY